MKYWNGIKSVWVEVLDVEDVELSTYLDQVNKYAIRKRHEVNGLNAEIKKLSVEIEKLNAEIDVLKVKLNTRSREKVSASDKQLIIRLREKGVTIKDLAEHFECSTATIHKIVKDVDIDLRRQKRGQKISTKIKEIREYKSPAM